MKPTVEIKKNKKTPTFVVELWNKDNYECLEDRKFLAKRMWAGKIKHIQTGKSEVFTQVSGMLKFMEDRRV